MFRNGVQADELVALAESAVSIVEKLRQRLAADVGIANRPIAAQPAKQLVDWQAQGLAANIPERDVDGRDGRRQDLSALEEAAPVQPLPDELNPRRVLTNQHRPKMLDNTLDGQFLAGDPGLA